MSADPTAVIWIFRPIARATIDALTLFDRLMCSVFFPAGNCTATGCAGDLNNACPDGLKVSDGSESVACKSACEAFGDPQYCCSGAYDTPETCRPTVYSEFFKTACPGAYSYAYDDGTSTFTCAGADYLITFCPSPSPRYIRKRIWILLLPIYSCLGFIFFINNFNFERLSYISLVGPRVLHLLPCITFFIFKCVVSQSEILFIFYFFGISQTICIFSIKNSILKWHWNN